MKGKPNPALRTATNIRCVRQGEAQGVSVRPQAIQHRQQLVANRHRVMAKACAEGALFRLLHVNSRNYCNKVFLKDSGFVLYQNVSTAEIVLTRGGTFG